MEKRGINRLVVTCACGMRMWVTEAHIGMTGHCRRCGQSIPITAENTEDVPDAGDTPERRQRHAKAILEQALNLIGRGKHEKALQILTAVLEMDDVNAEAWYWRGYALYKMSAYSDSCAALERALALGRPDVERLLDRVKALREWETGPEILLNLPVYRQTKTRDEARQYRMRVYTMPSEVLLAAGDYVAASEACYTQKMFPDARIGMPALVGVDSDMDKASRLLAARKFSEALPLLESAVQGYRNAGESCSWDHADALWNLGYALARTGRVADGVDCLTQAAALLAKRGRMKGWARCLITVLTHEKNGTPLSESLDLQPLVRVCRELGLRKELLWIHLLVVRALLESGRLREAQRVWTLVMPLALQAGGAASSEYNLLRLKLTPEACLRAVMYRLTETVVKGAIGARSALLGWDWREKPTERRLEALRAAQLIETMGLEDDDLRAYAANLCCELAIDAYAGGARAAGWAWWTAARDRDPTIVYHAFSLTRCSLDPARRQGLTRLLDEHVRRKPTAEAQAALAGLLVAHALEALELGCESKAVSCFRIAVKLGLRQDDLPGHIKALGVAYPQWLPLERAAGEALSVALMSAEGPGVPGFPGVMRSDV